MDGARQESSGESNAEYEGREGWGTGLRARRIAGSSGGGDSGEGKGASGKERERGAETWRHGSELILRGWEVERGEGEGHEKQNAS